MKVANNNNNKLEDINKKEWGYHTGEAGLPSTLEKYMRQN